MELFHIPMDIQRTISTLHLAKFKTFVLENCPSPKDKHPVHILLSPSSQLAEMKANISAASASMTTPSCPKTLLCKGKANFHA